MTNNSIPLHADRREDLRVGLTAALIRKGIPSEEAKRIASIVASNLEAEDRARKVRITLRPTRYITADVSRRVIISVIALFIVGFIPIAYQVASSGFPLEAAIMTVALSATAVIAGTRSLFVRRRQGKARVVRVEIEQRPTKSEFPERDFDQFADAIGRLSGTQGPHLVG